MSKKLNKIVVSAAALAMFSTTLGSGIAFAADVNPTAGITANEEWVRTDPAPQDLFTAPGIGPGMANRALPEAQPYVGNGAKTKIGDVNVTATIEKLPNTSPGTVFVETGPRAATHAQYDGTSNIFFAGATVPTLPALDFSASSSTHCVNANSTLREKLNFKGDCEMVDLVIRFDRPVNGAIIDFSGLGGAYQFNGRADKNVPMDTREEALNVLRNRSSFMAQSFELLTPNVNMELSNADSTNLTVENNTVKNITNVMGTHCRPNSLSNPSGVFAKFDVLKNPNHEAAGCGSVLINGQNMTELRFRVRTHTTPFTAIDDNTWGGAGQPGEGIKTNVVDNPRYPLDVASAAADGVNGYYWHPDFGTAKLIEDSTVMNNPITDKVRLSIRLVKYSIGDYIWYDANEDGIQDANERPAKGVKVHLLDGEGNPVRDANGDPITTVTNDEGKYIFNDLTHNVDYKVRVEPPKGFAITKPNVGGEDAEDNSKADADGVTSVVRFDANKYKEDPEGYSLVNLKLDAGLVPTYSLGDKVWYDANEDGIQDGDELPAKGVKVHLLDGEGNPVLDADGEPVTTTTNDDGLYLFEGLKSGVDYKVRVEPPKGYEFTKPNVGGEDAEDNSKADVDGVTSAVRFDPEEFKNDPENYTKTNLKLDAGLVVKKDEPKPSDPSDPTDPNNPTDPSNPTNPNDPQKPGVPGTDKPGNGNDVPEGKKVVLKPKLVNTGSPADMLSLLAVAALLAGMVLRFALKREN